MQAKSSQQRIINHYVLILDGSSSMASLRRQAVTVIDGIIADLAEQTRSSKQVNRVTVYSFAYETECLLFEMDALHLDSIADDYRCNGMTAFADAVVQAMDDLKTTPTKYGDHAFVVYAITDGLENHSRPTSLARLRAELPRLPDNWTVAAFVPNVQGRVEAKKLGFADYNIQIWDATSERGMAEVGETIRRVNTSFTAARSAGIRGGGTRGIFQLDTANLDTGAVVQHLDRLHFGQYRLYDVDRVEAIAPFVEGHTGIPYRLGTAYYQFMKPEKIQAAKQVALYDKQDHSLYTGASARALLGLPDYEVRVDPAAHPKFEIYVQSTSVNRKLIAGTKLLLMA